MVDYSKWKNIEVSDDEDESLTEKDTTPLTARPDFISCAKDLREDMHGNIILQTKNKIEEILKKMLTVTMSERQQLELEMSKLEKTSKKWEKELVEMEANEGKIIQADSIKTIEKMSMVPPFEENLNRQEYELKYEKFVDENEVRLKTYAMFKNIEDSLKFLQNNSELICKETKLYLSIQGIKYLMKGELKLVEQMGHRLLCILSVEDFSKKFNLDTKSFVQLYFKCVPEIESHFEKYIRLNIPMFLNCVRAGASRANGGMPTFQENSPEKGIFQVFLDDSQL